MNAELELEQWRDQWQADTPIPADLQKHVERQSLLMKLRLAADILVTVGVGGWVTTWAVTSHRSEVVQLAGATWIFLMAAWSFGTALTWGSWRPAAVDTATFLELSLRRCRNALRTIWFSVALLACEVAFLFSWFRRYTSDRQLPLASWLLFGTLSVDLLWFIAIAFLGFLAWYRRRKSAELVRLLQLQKEIASGVMATV